MKPIHRIIAADTITDLGNRLVSLALMERMVFQADEPRWRLVGLILAEQMPSILLSPIAGAVLDRLGVRSWIKMMLAVKVLLSGALLWDATAGGSLFLYFLIVSTSLCFHLGRLALVPQWVQPGRLIAFNALNERIGVSCGILAYPVMGRLVSGAGPASSLIGAGILFSVALFVVCSWNDTAGRTHTPSGRHLKALKRVSRTALKWDDESTARCWLWIMGAVVFAGGTLNVALPLLAKSRFGHTIAGWGAMMAVYQAGSLGGTFILHRLWDFSARPTALSITLVILACAMAAIRLVDAKNGFYLLMAFCGCGFTIAHIQLESRIQQFGEDGNRGRLAARMAMARGIGYGGAGLAGLCLPAGAPLSAVLWGGVLASLMAAAAALNLQWRYHSG